MTLILWIGFILLVFAMLALDLGVFHKKHHIIRTREAILWTIFWVILSLIFNVFIYYAYEHHWITSHVPGEEMMDGGEAALKYFTGYIIEKSLSLDNIFVIAMIFSYFKVPGIHQHGVLFWGILGALVMRGIMIAAGTALIQKFTWMIYVFGALLIFTALKMLFTKHEDFEPDNTLLVRWARRLYPVSPHYDEGKFFTKMNQKRAITPLFLVLLVIESTDALFAIDSIPAIFAVTTDPFIVFTSNVFAILGLRSLYFALAAMINKFRYLKSSLVFVLFYVGLKMILSHSIHIPVGLSLGVILAALTAGIAASIFADKKNGSTTTI